MIPRKIQDLDIFDMEDNIEDETQNQTGSPRKIQHLDIFSDDSDNSDDESQKVPQHQHQNRAITEIHSDNPVFSRRRPAYAPPATPHEIDILYPEHVRGNSDDSDNSDDESQKVYQHQHQNRAITEIHSAKPVFSRRRPAYAPLATPHEIDILYPEHVRGNIIFIVPSNKDWSEAATKAFQIPKNGIRIFRNTATKWFERYIERKGFTAKLKQKDSNVLTYECTGCI